uniref:Uncharacterized protein n=1 Tax=Lepeophtheirus salmonis TaxID=72036 RepID=A0A0K2UD45_LEPSM
MRVLSTCRVLQSPCIITIHP